MNLKQLTPILAFLAICGCSSDEPGPKNHERQRIELTRSQQEVVTAQNQFALNLFDKCLSNENNVISPLSLSIAMSMAANGANGDTYTEISNSLGFEKLNIEDINTLYNTLIRRLPAADKMTTLSIANSLWIQNGFPILQDFDNNLQEWYDASSINTDLNSDKSVKLINNWVSSHTHGHIDNYITSPLHGEAAMVNALYFKSKWSNRLYTTDRKIKFHNASGTTTEIEMMNSGGNGRPAVICDGATVVRLPYGNGTYHFTAVLPPEGMSLKEYINSITGETLMNWTNLFDTEIIDEIKYVDITLPKFSTTSRYDLIPILQNLGIKKAFSPMADFSKMSPAAIMITKVLQTARIEVDEEGSVASASTTVVTGITDNYMPPPPVLILDRPFLYLISESSTGAILFIGNVSELH